MRRNKKERRSFDERKMRENRREMESGADNRRTMDEREMRGYPQNEERNIGWDRRLMKQKPNKDSKQEPAVKLWL
jgi:hypothetical protein